MNIETPETSHTRSSLLNRLKDWDDAESWRVFYNTYWRLIYNTAVSAGLNDAEAQDVVQETVRSVAMKMPGFKYDRSAGSFKGWLMQLTRWRILNELKKRLPGQGPRNSNAGEIPHGLTLTEIADPATVDLDAYWEREWQKSVIGAAIQRVKAHVNPKQFEIFHLLVVKRLPAAKVAACLEVSRAQVYLARHRVAALVKKEARRLETEMI